MFKIHRGLCVLSCLLASVVGCGGQSYRTAEVDGVLTIAGKPGDKIQIQFTPDVDKGVAGPASVADTDSDGRFKLELVDSQTGSRRAGAVVGWHRVSLGDKRMSESATGKGVPIRLTTDYTLPSTTPLKQEVKEGKQTIEIKIP